MKLAIFGGSGRTGRAVVERALAGGHHVRALVRDASRLTISDARLEVLTGLPDDPAAVARLLEGCDAVISTLGPTAADETICSRATAVILATLQARRYVLVSGAGVDVLGDEKRFADRLISWVVRVVSPRVFADKVLEYQRLQKSDADFVAVRPPRLLDGPAKGPALVSLKHPLGNSLTRSDLAAFIVQVATTKNGSREAPFVSSP